MDTRYRIQVDSQLGPREGELLLHTEQGRVEGTFRLLGFDNPVSGECVGQTYRLRHKLQTLTRELTCLTGFESRDDEIAGFLETEHTKMSLRGCRIPARG